MDWMTGVSFKGCDFDVGLPSPSYELFVWKPCDQQADCEEAVWAVPRPAEGREVLADINHEPSRERLWVQLQVGTAQFYTDLEGRALSAVRPTPPCVLLFPSTDGDHFVAGVTDGEAEAVISGTIGEPGLALWTPLSSVGENVLGAKRFVFRPTQSIDAATGGDYRVLTSKADAVGDVYAFEKLTPELFLFEAVMAPPKSPTGTSRTILVSDGLATPTPWLAETDGGEDATIKNAGSHVAWVRGFGLKKLNVYDSVEIWAAGLDASGSPVDPKKIESVEGGTANAVSAVGGHGRMAAVFNVDRARVCDLAASACHDVPFPIPPNDPKVYFSRLVGLTSTHLWIVLSNERMLRLKL